MAIRSDVLWVEKKCAALPAGTKSAATRAGTAESVKAARAKKAFMVFVRSECSKGECTFAVGVAKTLWDLGSAVGLLSPWPAKQVTFADSHADDTIRTVDGRVVFGARPRTIHRRAMPVSIGVCELHRHGCVRSQSGLVSGPSLHHGSERRDGYSATVGDVP